jgi:hypothetical protein
MFLSRTINVQAVSLIPWFTRFSTERVVDAGLFSPFRTAMAQMQFSSRGSGCCIRLARFVADPRFNPEVLRECDLQKDRGGVGPWGVRGSPSSSAKIAQQRHGAAIPGERAQSAAADISLTAAA